MATQPSISKSASLSLARARLRAPMSHWIGIPDFCQKSRYVSCLTYRSMQQAGGSTTSVQAPSSDIVFACSHCSTSFVVDAAAAGMTLDCQKCGKPTTVPIVTLEAAADHAVKISDLQHQLKENESQRTEITSYINQLSIQLHRWQLRLQSLNERQTKLQAELAQLSPSRNS
jgi:transcription elongation factor Elf1